MVVNVLDYFNPIWTGLFANLKRLGGGGGHFGYFKSENGETC